MGSMGAPGADIPRGSPVRPAEDEVHVGALLDLLVHEADVVLQDRVVELLGLPARRKVREEWMWVGPDLGESKTG